MTTPHVDIHLVGPRGSADRRSAGMLRDLLACWPLAVIVGSVALCVGAPIYDKAGTPDVTIGGQVTALYDTPAEERMIPVVDGKGMTTLSVHYYAEHFEVRVHGQDRHGGYSKRLEVSETTFRRLSVGSPAELTYFKHRIGHGIEIEHVAFPTGAATVKTRRPRI